MNLRYLFVLLLLAVTVQAQAQQPTPDMTQRMQQMATGELRGQVVDAATSEPLPTASVAVYTARDSSLVTGAIANMEGQFVIEQLRPGAYYIRVSLVGYGTQFVGGITLTQADAKKDLGTIKLAEDTAVLDEVEVTAQRDQVTFAIDRTIYNVSEMPAASVGSTTELLQNVPSVEVDVDGKVSLRGNQNVVIYINGKPAPVRGDFLSAFLQQMPANMIERVEVIPNPSAKYDPEGMAGILNIVLKQNAELGLGGGITSGIETNGSYNLGGNLNYQKGKFSLFANYGFRHDDRDMQGFNYRTDLTGLGTFKHINSDNLGNRGGFGHNANLTLDYRLSDKNTLSLSALGSLRSGQNDGSVAYSFFNESGSDPRSYVRNSLDESDGFNTNVNLSFRRVIESGRHEFEAQARYNYGENTSFNTYEQTMGQFSNDPLRETSDRDAQDQRATLQLDYTRPLGASTKLEAGYKGELALLDSRFLASSFDFAANTFVEDFRNDFTYDQQIHAAYAILGHSFGKFDAQIGLRAEQANTTFTLLNPDQDYDNSYFSLYPSAFIAYKPDIAKQFKLNYSKRVQRPHTMQLNPFTNQEDPLNLFVGNPALKPTYTHSFEIGYQQFTNSGSFSVTPYYRYETDIVRRIKTVDEASSVSTVTFQNLDESNSWGVETVAMLRMGQSLNGRLSLNAYREVTDNASTSANSDIGADAFGWSLGGNLSWQATPATAVQVFGFYRAPRDVEQGRIAAMTFLNLSIRQQLFDGKGALSLSVRDPFNQMGMRFETGDAFFFQEGEMKWQARSVGLTFQYNFGQVNNRRNRPQGDEQMGGEMEDVGIR